MTETKQTSTTKTDRRPDCVTEIRMGNSVLTVSGFFKQGATDTAADKMMKVLEAEVILSISLYTFSSRNFYAACPSDS